MEPGAGGLPARACARRPVPATARRALPGRARPAARSRRRRLPLPRVPRPCGRPGCPRGGGSQACAQGLHGGVGAGDPLLLPAHRVHCPRVLLRDPRGPGQGRPEPGRGGFAEGPRPRALQPAVWVLRVHQLGHLRGGGPLPALSLATPPSLTPAEGTQGPGEGGFAVALGSGL